MKSGIYQITNKINNKIYIGSSVNIEARWAGHRSDLKNKKHHSRHLQHSWELHGSGAFEFMYMSEVLPRDNSVKFTDAFLVRWRTGPVMSGLAGKVIGWHLRVSVPFWVPFMLLLLYPAVAFAGDRKRYLKHLRRISGLCIQCGYDLTGNISGICPECGCTTKPAKTNITS